MGLNPVELYRSKPGAPDISFGDLNWHVKLFRRMLAYAGYGPPEWLDYGVPVSDQFDQELLALVHEFQSQSGRPAGDTVDHALWEALAAAGEAKHQDDDADRPPADRQAVAARIVEIAKAAEARHIREHGHNKGATVQMILAHAGLSAGQPWCVAFAWAVVDLAYFLEQEFPPKIPGGAKRSCTALVNWARQHGCIVEDVADVMPGDLIVLKKESGSYFHIGICVGAPRPDGRINTIEGNTNVGGSAEGDGIYDKQRGTASCTFVRL